jgi:hypothetical protein
MKITLGKYPDRSRNNFIREDVEISFPPPGNTS